MELNKIYNEDCLEGMKKIPDKSIDMILSDLPYGTIKGASHYGNKVDWDVVINTKELFEQFKRVLKPRGRLVLTAQEPFTSELKEQSDTQLSFNYRMVWVKEGAGNPLFAKKAPLKYYEDILVFTKELGMDCNEELREYFRGLHNYINKTKTEIFNLMGNSKSDHTFRYNSLQFSLCTEETYLELTDLFDLKQYKFYKEYSELQELDENNNLVYNILNNKSNKDVFHISKDNKSFHPTQKPVELFEQLIKMYSNSDDIVLDVCMGSGTTAIAAINTNRNYIGFELDEEYYNLANERISKTLKSETLETR